jgi:hypothetical protein
MQEFYLSWSKFDKRLAVREQAYLGCEYQSREQIPVLWIRRKLFIGGNVSAKR